MQLEQVVFEYGQLHLNFVAAQRMNQQLSQQLSDANKEIAALKKDLEEKANLLETANDALKNAQARADEAFERLTDPERSSGSKAPMKLMHASGGTGVLVPDRA